MSLQFCPMPYRYAAVRMDPVAMVKHLQDPLALAAARAMQCKTHLVYVDSVSPITLPICSCSLLTSSSRTLSFPSPESLGIGSVYAQSALLCVQRTKRRASRPICASLYTLTRDILWIAPHFAPSPRSLSTTVITGLTSPYTLVYAHVQKGLRTTMLYGCRSLNAGTWRAIGEKTMRVTLARLKTYSRKTLTRVVLPRIRVASP